jgi:hypothetical protein
MLNLSGLAQKARERTENLSSRLVSFASPSPGLRLPAPSPSRSAAGSLLFGAERDDTGELTSALATSRLSGGVAGVNDLGVFVMTSDFANGFCCGVVSGGVKLCTCGAGACTIKAHRSNKVKVCVGSLYIAAGRNAAYAQHHADASGLQPTQLANVLKERRSKDEWVRLLHGLKLSQEAQSRNTAAVSLSAITPSKKRKPLGGMEESYNSADSPPPALAAALLDDSDTEGLVIISSMSSEDLTPEEKLEAMSQQWDNIVAGLNRLTRAFKRFRSLVSTELEVTDDRITGADARIGFHPI